MQFLDAFQIRFFPPIVISSFFSQAKKKPNNQFYVGFRV